MKVLFLTMSIFCSCNVILAQDTASTTIPARFAIAYLPEIYSNGNDECVVFYDNGCKENLVNILNLSPKQRRWDDRNVEIVRDYEFKMLQYMYGKGFELLSIYSDRNLMHNQFYFKRK